MVLSSSHSMFSATTLFLKKVRRVFSSVYSHTCTHRVTNKHAIKIIVSNFSLQQRLAG